MSPTDPAPGDTSDLRSTVATRPVVLDGGLATLLERHGHDLSSHLWSARLLRDDPAAIEDAHREFFAAGAEVATTASYQVSFEGFGTEGVDRGEVERLLRRSVALAAAARDEAAPGGWVAASVGPYGAVLADGSEYRGDYGLDVAALRAFHRPRLDVLASTVGAGADVLAVETVPCLAEVEAVLAELDGSGVPAWLSLSASEGRTRAGEPLEEAFAMAADVAEVLAVGVNCTTPADTGAAVEAAGAHKPAVVYPNSGQSWDAEVRAWTGRSAFHPEDVSAWVAAGARLVGGCCRVGPEDIASLREALAGSA
ncbi:homocysteine S-methyltransferase [Nocardioides sp. S-58]|uniref:Homocysteine S-methyltransferase n=1 Tax=Nocardioides renjunii TaxID=3095075 RepID=A0ABU5KAY8_9ACTN|nr:MULTISPECIES: homocysteine S-methyltransferase [unclassified Nocardioides]MDZ5662101.1 homocysteine S-methyltransferase [Nocardioides sp. S-58]WQQ24339.1 homocysteine S-methyltransferase [Nocardioides sp. S-34]